jgi:hypothetical protein
MKTLILLIASVSSFAQATINAPAITLDAESSAVILDWMTTQLDSPPMKLMNDMTANSPAVDVEKLTKVSVNSVIAIGSEHMVVNSINGNKLMVTRGYNGTTKATHAGMDTVNVLLYPTLNQLGKQLIVNALRQIVEIKELESASVAATVNARGKAKAAIK